jgi:hypothetical protein
VATNLEEALQGAGAVSAKPVTMEALPEATIDVGGGSQSLEIEGLGVKRRKDDLSVTTSSTSQIAIQDLFGDLLDEVNFSDPTSVDAFRDNAANRISGLDSASIDSILGRPSTIAEDTAALSASFASTFADEQSSKNQFRQLFGPPEPPSVAESGSDSDFSDDAGFDFDAAGFGLDVADPVGDPNFGSIAGLGIGALGPGSFDVGAFAAQQAGAAVGVNFGAIQGALNADISNPASAVNAVFSAIDVTSNIADIAQRGVSIPDLFSNVERTIEGVAQSVYNAITNPEQELASFGMNMAYGTQFPDLYQFDLPQGQMNFAFDKVTGKIATPGLLGFMMGMVPTGVMSSAYNFAQGHSSMQQQQDANRSAIDAFAGPQHTTNNPEVGVYSSPTAAQNLARGEEATTGSFAAVDMSASGIGAVGFDLGALAEAMGPEGNLSNLSYADYEAASLNGTMGHGSPGFDAIDEEQAILDDLNAQLEGAGLSTSRDIAEAAQASAVFSSVALAGFEAAIGAQAIGTATAVGNLSAYDITQEEAAGYYSDEVDLEAQRTDVEGRMENLSSAVAAQYKDQPNTLAYAIEVAKSIMSSPVPVIDPLAEIKAYMAIPEVAYQAIFETPEAGQARADYGAYYGVQLGSFDAQGYNSPDPSRDAMDLANFAMDITQRSTFNTANVEDESIGAYMGSLMGAFDFSTMAETIEAFNNEPLGAFDMDMSNLTGFHGNIGDADAASDAMGTDVTGTGPAAGAPEDFSDDMTQADQDAAATEAFGDLSYGQEDISEADADCFVQGTPVLMEDGSTKAIEKVVVGDLVAGKDGNANEVKSTHIRKPDIPFLYGFNGHKPFVTAYHPFMTKEGWGCFEPEKFKEHRPAAYQELANEQGGKDLIKIKKDCEILRSDNEWVLVEDVVVEGCDPNLTVYNLSVANDKTFVANSYIVHNKADSGSWVICTELKNQGKLDAELYNVASVYFRNNLSQDILEGYWAWAISYAERMKHNKLATAWAKPWARGRAVEIAHRIDPSKYPKSSFLGKLTIWLGEPICSLIGKSIRLFKNKQLVNKRLDY